MTTRPPPISLKPDPAAIAQAATSAFVRAAICVGAAVLDRHQVRAADVARSRGWTDDRSVDLLLKAATSPTALGNTPALTTITTALLAMLVPQSAGAALLERAINLSFDTTSMISVPGIAPSVCGFVGEGAPIPVVTSSTSAVSIAPAKLATIVTMTGELLRSTNAEALFRQVLIESAGPGLDAVLFGTAAATSAAPAGLLHNISALTPSSSTNKSEAIVDDLQTLGTAVAPIAGNSDVCLVASPGVAVALALRMPQHLTWPILASASLPARTLIAVVASTVAFAADGSPAVDATTQAEFVRDSAPQEVVTSSGVVGTSVGSLFQTDQVGLRLRWPISWALRDPRGVAWMSGVNW